MKLPKYLNNLDSFIAAIIGFIAIYYIYTSYSGIGISPDSIMYASTAHSIYAHHNLITFNGGPLVFFPVFYPVFLSIILFITRINTIEAAPVINGLLFAGVIFFSGYVISKFKSHSVLYKWFILLGIVLSPGLLEIYTYLWSETLFIFEIMLFVWAYWHYMQKHSMLSLILLSILVAISCITRYAGVTLIMTGGLLLLLDKHLELRKKIAHILIFGFASISLLAVNLIVNRLSSGLSTGTREPSITPLSKNLYYFGTVICDWAGLPQTAYPYATFISCTVLAFLLGLLVWKGIKDRINTGETIIIMFAVVYGIFIPVLATFSRFEPLNSRLMSPVYICLLIGITSWVPDVIRHFRFRRQLLFAIPFVILMLDFEYAIAARDYQRWDDENDYGVPGYTDDDWNKSDFITFLKSHKNIYKPSVPIYTDADEAVYFFTGASSTLLPHRYFSNTVKHFYSVKHYYLIWFGALNNVELIGLKDIQQHENLKLLYQLKDGAVYEFNGSYK
jgi:hypothetical protein